MFKRILQVTALGFAGLCAVAAMQPDTFHVERSAEIKAPAKVIFKEVNHLKSWHAWSPWAKMDPNATESFEGPEAGKDAAMSWEGNSDVGKGTMTIVESVPNEKILFRLDFKEPMEGTSDATFTFAENKGITTVTWVMDGKNNFIGKLVGLLMNCEAMVGGQFEEGLASLKAIAEK